MFPWREEYRTVSYRIMVLTKYMKSAGGSCLRNNLRAWRREACRVYCRPVVVLGVSCLQGSSRKVSHPTGYVPFSTTNPSVSSMSSH